MDGAYGSFLIALIIAEHEDFTIAHFQDPLAENQKRHPDRDAVLILDLDFRYCTEITVVARILVAIMQRGLL